MTNNNHSDMIVLLFAFNNQKNRSIIASCGLNVDTIACWQVPYYLAVCCKTVTFVHLTLFRSAW